MSRLTLLLASGFILMMAAAPVNSENFSSQVWTYDEFKGMDPTRKARIQRFEGIVGKEIPPTFKSSTNKKILISVIYPGKQASDYWHRSVKSLEGRLNQAAVNYQISSLFTEPSTEVRQQEKFIRQELRKNPDYMIFTLDALRHKSIIERIVAQNETKLILQNITTPVKEWRELPPFLYVGFDHEVGSKLLADEYISQTGGKGNYAVFFGPRGYVSQMRGDTFISYLTKNSDLKMAASYYVGFNRERSKKAALALLAKRQDIKFIYACSTDIALGIIDALKDIGMMGKVMVNGWGGGSSELAAIQEGELDFTVMRMNDDNGVAMADAIILDQNGEGADVPAVYSGEINLVGGDIAQDEINILKKRAFRYSN